MAVGSVAPERGTDRVPSIGVPSLVQYVAARVYDGRLSRGMQEARA